MCVYTQAIPDVSASYKKKKPLDVTLIENNFFSKKKGIVQSLDTNRNGINLLLTNYFEV